MEKRELWINLSVSICYVLLIIAMSDVNGTVRECLPDASFCIAITIRYFIEKSEKT